MALPYTSQQKMICVLLLFLALFPLSPALGRRTLTSAPRPQLHDSIIITASTDVPRRPVKFARDAFDDDGSLAELGSTPAAPRVAVRNIGKWTLTSANGSVVLRGVKVPGYALQALQDAGVVGDPLHRYTYFCMHLSHALQA